ncbi:hypothetical protein NL344_29125, partial [Klebsiella pneumoniae]|nr:hypothetical protein [Klebsiella pneumoniae]
RNLTAEGDGLLIQLRRRAAAVAAAGPGAAPGGGGGGGMAGFEAEAVYLRRDVHIVVQNVGSTNILPGQSKPNGAGQVPMD